MVVSPRQPLAEVHARADRRDAGQLLQVADPRGHQEPARVRRRRDHRHGRRGGRLHRRRGLSTDLSAPGRMPSAASCCPRSTRLRTGARLPITEAARLAEELGFAAAWAGDHLACPAPGLDAPACLAAAAAVTDRIGLGFSVMLLGLCAARVGGQAAAATIDHLAGAGRLRLGVGVGGEFPERVRGRRGRCARARRPAGRCAATCSPTCCAGRPVDYAGTRGHVRSPAARASGRPRCPRSTSAAAASRRCVAPPASATCGCRCGSTPAKLAERSAQLAELAPEHGPPRPGAPRCSCGVRIDDDRAGARAGRRAPICRASTGWALDKVEHWTLLDSIDGAVERLSEYRDGGGRGVLMLMRSDPIRWTSTSTRRGAERCAGVSRLVSSDSAYRYDASALPRGVRAPLHLSGGRRAQQPPLRRRHRACTIRPRAAAGPTPSCGATPAGSPPGCARRGSHPADVVVSALFNCPEFVLAVARRPAPRRGRRADQLPPLRRGGRPRARRQPPARVRI